MKKTLLTLLSAAVALTAAAGPLALRKSVHIGPAAARAASEAVMLPTEAPVSLPPMRAEAKTMNFTMAGEPEGAFKIQNTVGYQCAMAFEITPEMSAIYAGNQITGITYYTGGNGATNTNLRTLYTGFIANDFDADPIVKKGGLASTSIFRECTINISTPVTIEAGKRYIIGVHVTTKDAYDYPFVYDGLTHSNDEGGWVATRPAATDAWTWQNVTDDYGFLCVGCIITGDNLPENLAKVGQTYGDKVANANTPFEIEFEVINTGANELTSIDYTYTIGGSAPVEGHFEPAKPLAYNTSDYVTISDAKYPTPGKDAVPYTVTITKVNGADNRDAANTGSNEVIIIPEGKGYQRNMVVEEGTSINCGYCPRGIWSLEYLREKYTDGSVACVAVHGNGLGPDPMTATSWAQFNEAYINGYPSGVINRMYATSFGGPSEMEYWYNYLHSMPALSTVQADVMWANEERTALYFNTTTGFVFDYGAGHPYTLSFAATEDKIGPYDQVNYYAGASQNVGGWQSKPNPASTIYNDVARNLDTFGGIDGSVPAVITADKEYSFHHTMALTDIVNPANVNAVVYLLDKVTGVVENVIFVPADKIKAYDPAGLTEIVSDNDAPVEYFNLQGIRVAEPTHGLYIRRQGSDVTKVIL